MSNLHYRVKPWYSQLFCKHYYVIIKDAFNNAGKRQLNHMGYCSMTSQCRLCGKVIEHD